MRYTAEEKEEIIRVVKSSEISISEALRYLGIPKRSFYNWYHKYSEGGLEALRGKPSRSPHTWNRIPDTIRALAIELALEHPEITPRELSVKLLEESGLFISESSYYRILRAAGLLERIEHDFVVATNEYKHKTQFPNEMWQTDFTYFKVKGFGWYYLSTVLDDYSRYIIHWELCSSMSSEDVARSIDQAMLKAGLDHNNPPKLLSDNGPCYIASSLKEHLDEKFKMKHIHGKPLHPQTQGKIERYHRSMKRVIKLQHYFAPSELEKAIAAWVQYYNEQRYHESLDNLRPIDVYMGQQEQILKIREQLKSDSLNQRYQANKLNQQSKISLHL